MIVTSVVDTHAREGTPNANYGGGARLWVNGGAGGNNRNTYIYFSREGMFPLGAMITKGILRLRLRDPWPGTNNITVQRVIQKWTESKLTWNNRPTHTTSGQVAKQIVGGSVGDVIEIDVSGLLQAAADGSAFFGFRIMIAEDVNRAFNSGESVNAAFRPQLDVEWSEAPHPPDRLSPDAGQAVHEQPLFRWRFTDKAGSTVQESSQVQISFTTDFSSPDYDSGKVANEAAQWEATGYTVPDAATRFWRVRVWDATDLMSGWSEPAEFVRDDLGTLSLLSPGAMVDETTPPVIWELTGETQERYKVELHQLILVGGVEVADSAGGPLVLWRTSGAGTTDTVTIKSGLLKTGVDYRVVVESWDTKDRYNDEHRTVQQDFTYERAGGPTAPSGLVATPIHAAPGVRLTWSRATTPDYFALRVDGVEVMDRIEPADVLLGGTDYAMTYWLASPRGEEHVFEVEAVVQDTPGDPYLHSAPNPTASARTDPVGIWLVDPVDDTAVQIVDKGEPDFEIAETAATFYPLEGPPVRVTNNVRGYEGSVGGRVIGSQACQDFRELKRRAVQGRSLHLIIGDVAVPVMLEGVRATPTPVPGDLLYAVSFAFFQSGPPWPVVV